MITPEGCDVPSSPRYAAHFAAFRDAPAPQPATGDWTAWTELLRRADDDDPHRAMTVAAGAELGTVCSTLLALPAAPSAPPVMRFANGPPTRVPYEPVTAPWVRGANVEGALTHAFQVAPGRGGARQARAAARRPQRPDQGRRDRRRDAHHRRAADAALAARARREDGDPLAPRPPRRQAEPEVLAAPGRGAARGAARHGRSLRRRLRRRGGRRGVARAARRRVRAVRERALPRRRRGERSCVRARARARRAIST